MTEGENLRGCGNRVMYTKDIKNKIENIADHIRALPFREVWGGAFHWGTCAESFVPPPRLPLLYPPPWTLGGAGVIARGRVVARGPPGRDGREADGHRHRPEEAGRPSIADPLDGPGA